MCIVVVCFNVDDGGGSGDFVVEVAVVVMVVVVALLIAIFGEDSGCCGGDIDVNNKVIKSSQEPGAAVQPVFEISSP